MITACRGVVYKARYALFTPSLGVLKAGSIAFDPPLPAAKQAVIDMMGFGVMDKARGEGGGAEGCAACLPCCQWLPTACQP